MGKAAPIFLTIVEREMSPRIAPVIVRRINKAYFKFKKACPGKSWDEIGSMLELIASDIAMDLSYNFDSKIEKGALRLTFSALGVKPVKSVKQP